MVSCTRQAQDAAPAPLAPHDRRKHPHPGSIAHAAEQQSPLLALPSSHSSWPSRRPLPHAGLPDWLDACDELDPGKQVGQREEVLDPLDDRADPLDDTEDPLEDTDPPAADEQVGSELTNPSGVSVIVSGTAPSWEGQTVIPRGSRRRVMARRHCCAAPGTQSEK
jgi:hypothetical protein